jgi:hypothetical protein
MEGKRAKYEHTGQKDCQKILRKRVNEDSLKQT